MHTWSAAIAGVLNLPNFWSAINQDPARDLPAGVAEGGLSQMWGRDNSVSHVSGRGGRGAGEGNFFGEDLQLLPEQDQAGCEDV